MSDNTESQNYAELYVRFTNAQNNWLQYKPRLEETYEYTQPYRNKFYFEYGGQRKGFEVFDTTAISATVSFTSSLMTALTPINQEFMTLVPGPRVPKNQKKKLEDYLTRINEILWRYLKKSNFAQAINESYYDVAVGTGVISTQYGDDENPLVFAAHPLCEVFLERNGGLPVRNLWRYYEIPPQAVQFLFPKARVPKCVQEKMDTYTGSGIVTYAQGNLAYKQNGKMMYRDVLLSLDAGEIVQDETTTSSPWTVYRWDVPPREVYGIGVATLAMPTIKTLNKCYEFYLRQGAFASAPPFEYASNFPWNPYNTPLQPGMAIPITSVGNMSGQSIRPIDFGGNFNLTADMIMDLRNMINKIMFTDPLGSIQEPVRTATEMMMRQQETIEAMGPRFARLAVEFLGPLMKRIVFLLNQAGLLPSFEIDGEYIDIEFQMPIAKATGVSNLTTVLQTYAALSEIMSPELATAAFKINELPAWAMAQVGGDTRLVRSPQELQQIFQSLLHRGMSTNGAVQQAG